MEAVILAAGKGTRLHPHTLAVPKPLLPIQGRPILDWILAALPPQTERLLVVVNYLAEQIEDWLKSQRRFADWKAVRQEAPRGTGDAFRSCRPYLRSDRYLVLNGDDLYSPGDLAALGSHAAGVMVRPVQDPEKWGIAFRKPDGTLEKLVEKPKGLAAPQLGNIGAYVFPREVFDLELKLSPRGEYEITDYVTGLAARRPVQVVAAEHWLPIGDVPAWEAAQQLDLSSFTTPSPR